MPEISSESRPPDDPGQPPIGFPIDTDPVHPFVPSPDSNPPEPEPYVPENRERHSKHMRKLSVDSTDALPKAKVKFQVKRSKVQLPGHDEPIPAPPKSVSRSFFPGHSENPTASSSNQPQAADIPVPPSTVEDDDNQTTDSNETDSEPIFDEEDVKGFEKDPDKDLDDEKNLFVSFDDMDFCIVGPNQAPPSFNSYDPKGFSQFCQYLAKTAAKKTPKAESVITPEVLRKYAKEIKQAKLEEFRSFLDFTAMKYRDRRKHKIDNYVTGRWVLTIKIDKDGNFKKFKARWVCRGFQCPEMGPSDGLAHRDQVWFSRSMSACRLFFLGPVTHRLENCLSSGGTLRPRATRYSRSTSDRHRIASVSRRIAHPFSIRIE